MHKRPTRQLVVLIALLLMSGLPTTARADEPDELVLYKLTEDAKGEEVQLHLHVFKPEGWSKEDARPAIVFFFGGGWTGGTPTQFYPHCEMLAKHGMVAMAAEYRVRSRNGTPPQKCVMDGKSAVRFIRSHADVMGIDPEKIAAGGGSAGGHVAASTALVTGFEDQGEDLSVSSKPNLLVLFNPVIDTSPKKGFGWQRLGDDAIALSPLHGVYADQPASIVFHGTGDTTVPIEHVREFKKASEAAGATCVLKEYEGAPHGFFNLRHPDDPDHPTTKYYQSTTQAMLAFLKEHGFVPEE